MTARAQRWSWTAAMALLPFIIVAFGRWDIDVSAWSVEARMMTATFSAGAGICAATFPYREPRP